MPDPYPDNLATIGDLIEIIADAAICGDGAEKAKEQLELCIRSMIQTEVESALKAKS